MFRLFAWCYAVVVLVAAIYAWGFDVALRNDPREHLLPDVLLAISTMPMSLTMGSLYSVAPRFFDLPFVQLTASTILGALQVALLFWLARRVETLRKRFE